MQEASPIDFPQRFAFVTSGDKFGIGSKAFALCNISVVEDLDTFMAQESREGELYSPRKTLANATIEDWNRNDLVEGVVQRRFKDFKWLCKSLINKRKFKAVTAPRPLGMRRGLQFSDDERCGV